MGKIVFLGDSITKGTGQGTVTAAQTFASLIGAANGYSAIDIINAGVGGNNSAQALARLNTDVIANAPDVCVIMLGNNDCQGTNAITVEAMAANISQIINDLRADGIKPVLMSMGFNRGSAALFASYMPYLRALDEISVSAAVDYVDVYREFSVAGWYMEQTEWASLFVDFLHLTAAGHQYVASFAARGRFAGVFTLALPDPAIPSAEPLGCAIADYILLGASEARIQQIQQIRNAL